MDTGQMLYEGKGKKLFLTENANEVLVEFKDSISWSTACSSTCLSFSPIFRLAVRSSSRARFRNMDWKNESMVSTLK